ncbi:sugar ABC transporter ATP-binding protein [Herbiconiux sp. L3-i23]|uniref:sugar ABC transporter ATP-binding protein n=1 Tax=Herbiconiux sp. L3-i23 TaxID=2905871 RepID=UPI00205D9378|nr:sugar ABC transporter ATP-binding protein [Herbiconiux sp. L3-i23]BDI22459.1 galactose/methyl galactoside import ATP-binding protein MglA [Herbiconiux sp. L3-i23]
MSTVNDSIPDTATTGRRTGGDLIRVNDISKSFGGVYALKGVSFAVRPGVVHGLIGANGAGKSTLIKVLAGIEQPDGGEVVVEGETVEIPDPDAASRLGLAFIHQEMSLIPGWNVLRNMMLGQKPPSRLGVIDWRPARARASAVAKKLGMDFGLNTNVDDLSTADQWLVLIGRALMRDARMIAMDEPTASLSASEATRLHRIIRELAASGTAVLFVSHRLDEVSELCEDITVFKDGAVTRRSVGTPMTKPELVSAIVGRDLEIPERGHEPAPVGRPVLEVRGVADGHLVRDVSLTVHEGEVLGLAGLVGAGRTELAKLVYGENKRTAGEVLLEGRPVRFAEPADAVLAGIGLVPEERRSEGLFLDRTIDFNINISTLRSLRRSALWPFLRFGVGRRRATDIAREVTVKSAGVGALVSSLSGGNQQKVAIARWLIDRPRVLILDEPSRGVDVGARAEVHRVIRELAAQGTAVLAISSDNEELVALCDRVVVMAEGHVSGELVGGDITVDRLLSLSFDRETGKGTDS